MATIKTWKEKPSESEVQSFVEKFFDYLKKGELDNAKNIVDHNYDDWDETIYAIWRDHYLVSSTAEDESFEGKEWLHQLEWLNSLGILNDFVWYKETGNSRYFDVSITYNGEPSGFSAQFHLIKDEDRYFVKRGLIDMV